MIIVLKPGSSEADIEDVSRRVRELGFKTHLSRGEVRTIIGIVGDDRAKEQLLALQSLDSVENVVRILQPFKLASREAHPDRHRSTSHGGPDRRRARSCVMAGPCSVESRAADCTTVAGGRQGGRRPRPARRRLQAAHLALRLPGARGGRPRAARRGAQAHRAARRHRGHGPGQGRAWSPSYADILQIGARNMQNFSLLKEVGRVRQAGAAQARHVGDDRGVAAVRRVRPGRRQRRT